MSFHVGQHVVCVEDTTRRKDGTIWKLPNITKGRVYTVRKFGPFDKMYTFSATRVVEVRGCAPRPAVWLEEVKAHERVNPHGVHFPPGDDVPFSSYRFKPLTKLKVEDFMKVEVDA